MPSTENMNTTGTPVRKKKKKRNKFGVGDVIRIVVILVALGVFGFSLYKIMNIQKQYTDAQDIYANIESKAVTDQTYEDPSAGKDRLVSPTKKVNFEELLAIQPNTVGWIEIPACSISYPIVRGTDNDFYPDHAFNDEFSYSGAIFLDYRQSIEMKEEHIVIYGHHMKDGSMFCDLLEYDNEEFFRKNEGRNYFFIYSTDCIRVYEIFAISDVNIEDNQKAFTIDINKKFTILDYAAYVSKLALYNTGTSIDDVSQVVTLFTCQQDSASKIRHMVHGKWVENISYGN